MRQKPGSRSGMNERKLELTFARYQQQAKGYESSQKCVDEIGGGISRQGFNKGYRKWAAKNPLAPSLSAQVFGPGTRPYIENLKMVSKMVELERGVSVKDRRSTAAIIEMESLDPNLTPSSVNKHVGRGLAGKSPQKRGKKRILMKDDEQALVNYIAEASTDMEPLTHAEARGAAQSFVEGTTTQDKFKKGVVSKGFIKRVVQRNHVDNGGQLWSEFPQNMGHLRAEWTTFANLNDYFDVCRDVYLQTPNKIAVKNPAWDKATKEERAAKLTDEILIRRTDCLGSLDEMPFTLNMNTGQKSKSDKKLSGILEGAIEFGELTAAASGLRGKRRGRQRTTKFNKLGTVVAGNIPIPNPNPNPIPNPNPNPNPDPYPNPNLTPTLTLTP